MATSAMALSFMPPFFSIFEVWACLLLVGTIVFFFLETVCAEACGGSEAGDGC